MECIDSAQTAWRDQIIDFDRNDVLICFDIRRYQENVIALAEAVSAREVTVVLFTDRWLSPIARFARTLSTLFSAGVPLVEAMESVAGATGNIVYEDATMRMRDEVATGTRLQRAMENTGLFPNMVIQMIAVGEESGSLDAMSGKVADFYELEVDSAVDGLASLLEPLIMAILGVLVGGLVIAMYLPIFKLGAVV